DLAQAIVEAREKTIYCSVCCTITDTDPCAICRDESRDRTTICIVEEPKDVFVIERTREYHGLYHVLHGAISPMDGVGPQDLKIKEQLDRVQHGALQELTLPTAPSRGGEATGLDLARLLKRLGAKASRRAHGMRAGGALEHGAEVEQTK